MSYETVNPTDAKKLIDDGWTYVDVRTVEEFGAGHASGAFNVPFAFMNREVGRMEPNPEFAAVMKKSFAPDDKLVLACAAGGRSQAGCEILAAEGFPNRVNMHGRFSGARDMSGNVQEPGWESLGYPTETGGDPDKTYERLRGAG